MHPFRWNFYLFIVFCVFGLFCEPFRIEIICSFFPLSSFDISTPFYNLHCYVTPNKRAFVCVTCYTSKSLKVESVVLKIVVIIPFHYISREKKRLIIRFSILQFIFYIYLDICNWFCYDDSLFLQYTTQCRKILKSNQIPAYFFGKFMWKFSNACNRFSLTFYFDFFPYHHFVIFFSLFPCISISMWKYPDQASIVGKRESPYRTLCVIVRMPIEMYVVCVTYNTTLLLPIFFSNRKKPIIFHLLENPINFDSETNSFECFEVWSSQMWNNYILWHLVHSSYSPALVLHLKHRRSWSGYFVFFVGFRF